MKSIDTAKAFNPNGLELVELAQLIVIVTRYIRFAQITLLVYDSGLSFEKEIVYYWKPKKSSAAILFFLIHYGAVLLGILNILYDLGVFFLDPISRITHRMWQHIEGGAILLINDILVYVIVLCSDYVLLLRVRALYLNGRRLSIVLLTAYTLDVISAVIFFCIGIDKSLPVVVTPGPPIQPKLCTTANYSFVGSVIVWIAPFVYRLVCLVLILYRAVVLWKERGGSRRSFKLLNVIISDEGIYTVLYMVIVICSTQISIVFAAKSSTHVSLAYMVLLGFLSNPTLLSIAGRRMLINMKEIGARGSLQQGSRSGTRLSSLGTIGFVAPLTSGRVTDSSTDSDTLELQVRTDMS